MERPDEDIAEERGGIVRADDREPKDSTQQEQHDGESPQAAGEDPIQPHVEW